MKRSYVERPKAAPSPRGGFRQDQRAEIPSAALTPREQKVLATLRAADSPLSVKELARKCFPGMRAKPGTYETEKSDGEKVRHGTAAAYRCVLNSLRRLVVGGFAIKEARGSYVATKPVLSPTANGVAELHPQPETQETHHE